MASPIDICNRALDLLSIRPIVAFDGRSQAARSSELHYDHSRRTILRDHPWNFAKRNLRPAQVTLPDGYGKYRYAYQYPFDCLYVISVKLNGTGNEVDHEIATLSDGTKIIMANIQELIITYTADVENAELFDDLFEDALMYRMASQLSPLTKSSNKKKEMEDLYLATLTRARTIDGREEQPTIERDNAPWITARTSGVAVYRGRG